MSRSPRGAYDRGIWLGWRAGRDRLHAEVRMSIACDGITYTGSRSIERHGIGSAVAALLARVPLANAAARLDVYVRRVQRQMRESERTGEPE